MTYSNRLDLNQFFFNLQQEIYVVIKLVDHFPNYYLGSDIDIFCYNKNKVARKILELGNSYIAQGFEIRVTNKGVGQTYIDFYFNDILDFRFDLYQTLPTYKKIRLKEHYIVSIIENAEIVYQEFEGKSYPLYTPSTVDDLLLRYVEYIEWYEQRPDKVKHLEYILAAIDVDAQRIGFIDKLHFYTKLPDSNFKNFSLMRFYVFRWFAYWVKRISSKPVQQIPAILSQKVRLFLNKTTKSSL